MEEPEDPVSAAGVEAALTWRTRVGKPPVTLSDGVVLLRPWCSSDARFMAEAARDPAIVRFNGPAPISLADALAVIERIEQSWCAFDVPW